MAAVAPEPIPVIALWERAITAFYADGKRLDLLDAVAVLRAPNTSGVAATILLKRRLRQSPDNCMKCKVLCLRKTHRCHDCLYENGCCCGKACEFSLRLPHPRESAVLDPVPRAPTQ